MNLRPYQERATQEIAQKLASGKRKVIYQLATGGGKTVTFSAICSRYLQKNNKSILILVHRKELLQQTRRTLYDWYGISAQPIIAGMKVIPSASVYVGMVESVIRRIDRLKNIGLVIIDEAHLGNFKKLIPHFPDQMIIGFTATPLAASRKDPMKNHFEDIVCSVDIPDLIEYKSLAPCKTWAIKDNVNRRSLAVRNGDFAENEMAAMFKNKKQLVNTIKGYEQFALNKKTLIFNVNIDHSIVVCNAFVEAGYEARHLDGADTPEYRSECLKWLKDTPNAILCNVGILTTGFDEPSIEAVIVNKATMSLPLWLQMTGRAARPYPNKEHFTIIDLGSNAITHGDWCDARDWADIFHNPPEPKKDGVAPVKDCPKCFRILAVRTLVCPECKYEFPSPENEYDELPAEFTLVTKNLNVEQMIERNNGMKEYFTFFQIPANIATQAKYKCKSMSDTVAGKMLEIVHEKVKDWCTASGKPFNKWHKEKSKEVLFDNLKKNFAGWQPQ